VSIQYRDLFSDRAKEQMRALLMILFVKLNGDRPPNDTQLGNLTILFDEVIKEFQEEFAKGGLG
jgi:hypothetical protein